MIYRGIHFIWLTVLHASLHLCVCVSVCVTFIFTFLVPQYGLAKLRAYTFVDHREVYVVSYANILLLCATSGDICMHEWYSLHFRYLLECPQHNIA